MNTKFLGLCSFQFISENRVDTCKNRHEFFICAFPKLINIIVQDEEELDPEDVELDEHYTLETRSKCKKGIFKNNAFVHVINVNAFGGHAAVNSVPCIFTLCSLFLNRERTDVCER